MRVPIAPFPIGMSLLCLDLDNNADRLSGGFRGRWVLHLGFT